MAKTQKLYKKKASVEPRYNKHLYKQNPLYYERFSLPLPHILTKINYVSVTLEFEVLLVIAHSM